MWTLFKIINFIWLLTSTYAWFMTKFSFTPVLIIVNAVMIACMGFMPIEIKFDKVIGRVSLAILGISLWTIWVDGIVMGLYTALTYMPVLMLIMLPKEYKENLLQSITKWYATIIGLGLVVYILTLVIHIPSFGQFVHPNYAPYDNYLFFIDSTYKDVVMYGFNATRFNGIFLEPGHQALASTFLILANSYNFKKNRYCIILLIAVIFSFSLAGYLLLFIGWMLIMIKSVRQVVVGLIIISGITIFAINWNMGNNALNQLIITRLEYDNEKGIKGNNRFTENTDFVYAQGEKKGRTFLGMKEYLNSEKVAGAGYKIYIIGYGWIGVILAALIYLSIIPPNCNPRYTAIFLIVLSLCFIQRSYPGWYSWLLPYVLGIYIHSDQESNFRWIQNWNENNYT